MSGENTAVVEAVSGSKGTTENTAVATDFNDSAFFDDENIAENDLMGFEDDSSSEGDTEGNTEPKQSTSENTGTDGSLDNSSEGKENQDAGKEGTEKEGEKAGDQEEGKPPKGFVPHQALNQERVRRQELSRENAELKARLLEQEQAKMKDLPQDFQFKSEEELAELMEEDPVEALVYIRQEQKALLAKSQSEKTQQLESELKAETEYLVNSAWEDMRESIPELFDEKTSADFNSKLTDHAIKSGGFKKYDLSLLTSPATKVLTPDGRIQVLGPAAANITKLISNSYKSSSSDNIRQEIESQLREEITKDLISKFKSSGGKFDFKTLEQAPSRGKKDFSTPVHEDDWMELSDDEEERLLMGN